MCTAAQACTRVCSLCAHALRVRLGLMRLAVVLGCLGAVACAAQDDAGNPAEDAGAEAGAPDTGEVEAGGEPDSSGEVEAGGEPDSSGEVEAGLCTSCGGCAESLSVTSAGHVSGAIDYPDPPPSGGDHAPCWVPFGVHESEVPDERWVHNLEHGAVVFLYNCPDGCQDDVTALEFLAAPRPFALVTPYAALPTRFGVVAWGHRLLSDCYDEAVFEAFYDSHVNRAPESSTSPPSSGC